MNSVNSLYIDPIMINVPTKTSICCYNRTCMRGQEPSCSIYWLEAVQEIGMNCFQWEYKISKLTDAGLRYWKTLSNQHHNNTILMLYYPDDKHWQVCEHKPLFVWHQTLSNLGGTLSIWTGASVLSFLHLFEMFCYKCYKRNRRVGDNVPNV
uniref:Uncharacterized protein n=1 Tax=Romanomermis culicivorax TaxID=13658 RepID=A0A915KNM1_ROMCU